MVERHAWHTVRADRCAPHTRLQKLVLRKLDCYATLAIRLGLHTPHHPLHRDVAPRALRWVRILHHHVDQRSRLQALHQAQVEAPPHSGCAAAPPACNARRSRPSPTPAPGRGPRCGVAPALCPEGKGQQGRRCTAGSDQGAQFTSLEFTGRLAAAGLQISMDPLTACLHCARR